jgi:curved DNA-binding protein CbpA
MSFKIEQGLFNLDFVDHHAILGIPVDADIKDIRKRYLAIARRLHPDSCVTEDEAGRQRANEFLSKLVNPAYEKLSQERNYTEHLLLLKLKGQQALRQQETVVLMTDQARQLVTTGDVEQVYRSTIKTLAEVQYQVLHQTLERIGQLSELNLVYLMRKQGEINPKAMTEKSGKAPANGSKTPQKGTQSAETSASPPTRDSLVASNLRRAQEYESKQDYNKAIQELREALKISPTNAQCHTRLGVVYMKQNQTTMAKIHFNQALKLNPQDPVALEGKRRLDQDPTTGAAQSKAAKAQKPKDSKSDQSGGGLFGLFGGKKK